MEFFYFDGGCLGKVTCAKAEVVVVKVVLLVVERFQFRVPVEDGYIDGLRMSVCAGGTSEKGSSVMSGGGGACIGSRGLETGIAAGSLELW